MRAQFGSNYMRTWAYNLIGSNWNDTFCVPNEIGTQVWFTAGTSTGTIVPTLSTRTADMVIRSTMFNSATMWSKMTVQSQHRANTITYDKYAARIYPDTYEYDGSRYSVAIVGSIDAPDLDPTFRGRYIWGLNGSNFYTRFAGFTHCLVSDKRWGATIYGTLDSKTIPTNGTIATLIFRGTNNTVFDISPRRIMVFGSYTGTTGTTGTVIIVTKAACERDGGHVTMTSGEWDDIGVGTVWIGTFYVSPFFGTFRYRRFDEEQNRDF